MRGPLADESGPLPCTAVQSAVDDLVLDGDLCFWKSLYLKDLSGAAIVAIAWNRPPARTLVVIRQLGGAVSRVPAEATAFGDRSAPYHLSLDTMWSDPADSERCIASAREEWDERQPFATGGFYVDVPGVWEEDDGLASALRGQLRPPPRHQTAVRSAGPFAGRPTVN